MQSIQSELAPTAVGTYSEAIRAGNLIFLSGQLPLDPQTLQISSDEIRTQISQVFDNLSAVCIAAGGNLSNLVKLTVYLTDLNHLPLVNEAMIRYFLEPYPARASVGVQSLPRNAQVEIDGIMILPD